MICVFWCVLVYAFMYFYVYMGQVPEIKLMMMMMMISAIQRHHTVEEDATSVCLD